MTVNKSRRRGWGGTGNKNFDFGDGGVKILKN